MAIHRGEIYFVDLNPTKGREQAGRRPVLVLSVDAINRLPLVATVVVGTKGKNLPRYFPTNVHISPEESGLPLETVFCVFRYGHWMQRGSPIDLRARYQVKR